jgi:hypothetical protein
MSNTTRSNVFQKNIEMNNELYEIWLRAGGFLHKIKYELTDEEEKNKFHEDINFVFTIKHIDYNFFANSLHQIEYELNERFKNYKEV